VPFVLHLADGRNFRVDHPDYVFAGPSLGYEVLIDDGKGRLHYVSPNQITSIDAATTEVAA
ncbi:MAG TPA: hypothetical protein VGO11_06920, partial [Chthoniobacteraceae bacterium]|nr:hypothetical protein [Chthoniobacteraceae bacterium]